MIQEGIYTDLSSDDYHNDKASLSRSSIMDYKKSPRRYWANHLNPDRPPKEYTPSQLFGQAFHTLILEPHLFEKEFFVMPERVLLKNVGREAYDEYKKIEKEAESCKDKVVLSRDEYTRLLDMQKSFISHSRAAKLISEGNFESSYFWKDEHTGLMLKARPDVLHSNIYVDLKTTTDASPDAFQRSMALYGNHIQAAMVRDGVKTLTGETLSAHINICVESTYPYSVGIYIIDEAAVDYGHDEYKQILLDMSSSIRDNTFDDFPIQNIGLPSWYK
jgi:exodeoxyribonuclease VIII